MPDQHGPIANSSASRSETRRLPYQRERTRALLELAKAQKAVAFYPAGHPQLQSSLSQALQNIRPNLQAIGEMAFDVSRRGFSVQEKALGQNYPMLADLARDMHLRQIKKFAFRKDVTPQEFEAFLRLLAEDPDQFRSGKFIEIYFRSHQIRGIWVNEIDFGRALSMAQVGKRAKQEQVLEPDEQQFALQIDQLIAQLDSEKDPEKFLQISRELEVLAGQMIREGKMKLAWYILVALSDLAEIKRDQSEILAGHALRSVRSLARDEMLTWLMEQYLSSPPEFRKPYLRVFRQAEAKIVEPIINILAKNEALYSHRSLMDLLIKLGPKLREPMESRLKDSRAHVVRKVCFILGERKERGSVKSLAPLLDHADARVRKEAIRALSKIRGPDVARLLQSKMNHRKTDPETLIAIVQAFGDMKEKATVTALAAQFKKRKNSPEIREGIVEVLGKIGSKQALPLLIKTLNKKGLWDREQRLKIRGKAAIALGQIGGESALKALKRNCNDKSEELRFVCEKALKELNQPPARPATRPPKGSPE